MRASAHVLTVPGVPSNVPALLVRRKPGSRDDQAADIVLSELLGERVSVSWAVGPRRANRKPVLTLVDDRGNVAGFAKAGINDLTRNLVGREARALRALRGSAGKVVRAPRLLGEVNYGDSAFVVMTDVAGSASENLSRGPTSSRLLEEAMREIATLVGPHQREIRVSPWLARLRSRVHGLPAAKRSPSLAEALDVLSTLQVTMPFGSWHGDWQPGNFLVQGSSVAVWDWERYETEVPFGFDAQHLEVQHSITVAGTEPRVAAMRAIDSAPQRLSSWEIDSDRSRLVAALHLIDLAVRYLQDDQEEAGADLGDVEGWALPAANRELHAWTKTKRRP